MGLRIRLLPEAWRFLFLVLILENSLLVFCRSAGYGHIAAVQKYAPSLRIFIKNGAGCYARPFRVGFRRC
jgi:hypothetical protein